jgi:predicted RNA binding protein YcfA (HicA-like mRNA interferase family)
MPKRLGSDEVIRILRDHGFFFVTQRGSHELPIGTTRSIIRQSGLTPQDFGF